MRVLLITPDYPPPPGGIQTLVRNLERGLDALGHEAVVLQLYPDDYDGRKTDLLPTPRAAVSLFSRAPQLYPFYNAVYRATHAAIDDHDPDVVHAMHFRVWPALSAARERGVPTVVSTHAAELGERRLASVAFDRADAIHAVSAFTGSLIERDHGVRPDAVIPPSIDVDAYTSPPATVDTNGPSSVLSVARLVSRKNVGTLIDAWGQLGEAVRAERELVIAGDGPLSGSLRRRAERFDDVRLLGRVDDDEKRDRLAAADLFVLPANGSGYDVEGFGIVYLEAQAAGTPVIGSSVGGVPEAVGEGGLLVDDEHDAAELASTIERLCTDEAVRKRCLEAADGRIGGFNLTQIAQQHVDNYRTLVPELEAR